MAVDVLRPRSCIPGFYPGEGPDYVDTDVKLGEQVLSPGFKQHLDSFYDQAGPADRARCLELLTALEISRVGKKLAPAATPLYQPRPQHAPETTPLYQPRPPTHPGGGGDRCTRKKQRPHTAMATMVSGRGVQPPADPYGPYTTQYQRQFWGQHGFGADADRPASTRPFHASYPLSGPIGSTTYEKEFAVKQVKNGEQVRSGSSSGNRRNKPHPTMGFMNWRMGPKAHSEGPYAAWAQEVTDDVMDRVHRGQIRSTYQSDFMGIQQGQYVEQTVKPELDHPLPGDWRSKVPYTLHSIQRHSYQRPELQLPLKGNNSRYGCNKLKSVPAFGVVPTVSTRQMNLKTKTTYEREYIDGCYPPGTVDARSLGRFYAGNAVAAKVHGSNSQDARQLGELMAHLGVSPTGRPGAPAPPSSRDSFRGQPDYPRSPDPSYMSTWVGPM